MNEKQNADGTWSEAEPIKASWETNKLLQLFKKKKRSLWQRIKECFLIDKDKCFEENKNEKGICYGLYGGDKWSEYHCYQCIDCPHLTIYMKK